MPHFVLCLPRLQRCVSFAGAYGAHGLAGKSDKAKADWKTANQYHMVHALAMATLPMYQRTPARGAAGVLFTAGISLFSGSIYYACEFSLIGVVCCWRCGKSDSSVLVVHIYALHV